MLFKHVSRVIIYQIIKAMSLQNDGQIVSTTSLYWISHLKIFVYNSFLPPHSRLESAFSKQNKCAPCTPSKSLFLCIPDERRARQTATVQCQGRDIPWTSQGERTAYRRTTRKRCSSLALQCNRLLGQDGVNIYAYSNKLNTFGLFSVRGVGQKFINK